MSQVIVPWAERWRKAKEGGAPRLGRVMQPGFKKRVPWMN
jgi:hypothetical protein